MATPQSLTDRANLARASLVAFAGMAGALDATPWTAYPHARLIAERVEDVARGRLKRLMIFCPPQHGKSSIVSRFGPAWILGTRPNTRIVLASYEASYAALWGRRSRDLLTQWGPSLFGVAVRGDSKAADHWELEAPHNGIMHTAGAMGPVAGHAADILLCDDLIKNYEEAHSLTLRERTWDWFATVAKPRLSKHGAIVLLTTRWHDDDIAGRLMEREGDIWTVLSLPAYAEANDPLGRPPGEPLCPDLHPREQLEEFRRTQGSYAWSAVYQQRPSPLTGGLFKRDWFRYYTVTEDPDPIYTLHDGSRVPLSSMTRFATVDLAASTKETADYTVIASWGHFDGHLILLEVDRARREGPDIVPAIERAWRKWDLALVGIEAVAFQLSIVQGALRVGIPAREIHVDKDKVARALPVTALYEGQRIHHPRYAAWLADFETELLAFPQGAHDDCIDVGSAAAELARSLNLSASPPDLSWLQEA